MSIRAYRLLRNNKEEGPFTAEEIIQKNLKPYDLIWVDGRSAAWRYPGEMAEFKTRVPLPDEENNQQSNKPENSSTISASVHAAIAVNNTIVEPQINQPKPRYKVSAAWSKVQTITTRVHKDAMVAETQKSAVQKNVDALQPLALQSRSLSWEEAWLDWEKEKTEAPLHDITKIKPAAAAKPATINDNHDQPALETKYAEPLDSIKDKYIDNILKQKRSQKSLSFGHASQFVIPALALVIIFSVGFWLFHDKGETTAALNTITATKEVPEDNNIPEQVQVTEPKIDNTSKNIADINSSSNTVTATEESLQVATAEPAADQAEERKRDYKPVIKHTTIKKTDNLNVQSKTASAQIVSPIQTKPEKKVQQPDAVTNNTNKATDPSSVGGDLNADAGRPVRRRTDATAVNEQPLNNNETIISKKAEPKSSIDYVNAPEYIQMKDGTANLKIENVSNVDLDLVVVDVQYYDASNRFRKGETLYLHNLKAGKNIMVKTPKDTNALYATTKVSLVSSDADKVYIVGDK